MNILTFDIEEWFHILDNSSTKGAREWENYESRIHRNMDKIFKLLDDNNQSATFFCIGWIAKKYPDVIKRIDDLGYEIGTHSNMHQLAYEQSRDEYCSDLEISIKSLEDLIGKKITSYRALGFSLKEENKWVFGELIKNGIEIDCSIFPAKRGHGGFPSFGIAEPCWVDINGFKLKEFPINIGNILGYNFIYSGGGYFRVIPLFLLKQLFNKSPYTMTYFHPRDFDGEQPMIQDLSLTRKFKSYYGLKQCLPKLNEILKTFDFGDLQEANRLINWDKVSIRKI